MKEILLTSSVLILALLVLRRVFRRTVSRRVQYALWGLVLLRLLVPVSLPAAGFSLLTAAEPAMADLQALYAVPEQETVWREDGGPVLGPPESPALALGPSSEDNTRTEASGGLVRETAYRRQIQLPDLLAPLWYAGMALMACWLAGSNLAFWRRLRRHRVPFDAGACRYRVFLVPEGLPSPCLFGLFRPAVYLTPAAAAPERLGHVLAHEETHGRHLDPLWALLRGLCLTVYWFDPLVWAAALASRTDCELACDEGALRRLGADQRIPYGQTLLSLVPVRKTPPDPMLAATTMTAGKKQLKDRITRIAENRKNWGVALFAAVSLTALVCAVTFTGAKGQDPEPLSEEELAWFNEDFFNGEDFNIRNQFLMPDYNAPEEINLYALFYNGTGVPSDATPEERQAVIDQGYGGAPIETDLTKCAQEDMDRVLRENTGLALEETIGLDLDHFTYLEEYGAYYSLHGDTNYPMDVEMASGEREGDLVRLHYVESFGSGVWKCVTLREDGAGGWHFVSNLPWEAPMVYPVPIRTISLDGLKPKEFQPLEPLPWPEGELELLSDRKWADVDPFLDPYCLLFMTNGQQKYAGVQAKKQDGLPQPFLELPQAGFSQAYFTGILGHDGFTIDYAGADGRPVCDYYFLTKQGQPVLLARCGGVAYMMDLDNDGEREMVWPVGTGNQKYSRMFFLRDGAVYEADLRVLVAAAWPEAEAITFEGWDPANRCLGLSAFVPYDTSDGPAQLEDVKRTAFRALYFDGADLLLTEDPRSPAKDLGHMMGRYDAPVQVIDAARALAESEFLLRRDEGFDDWRVSTLLGPYEEITGGKRFEVWQTDFQLHTPAPKVLSGSAHLSEPTWTEPRRPSYLVFETDREGNRTLFTTILESDSAPGTASFQTGLLKTLTGVGGADLINLDSQELYRLFLLRPDQMMETVGTPLEDVHRDLILDRLSVMLTVHQDAWREVQASMEGVQLTRGGPEAWAALQARVDANADDPQTPVEALERMMKEETISMTLLTPDIGPHYDVDPQTGNGPNRALHFPTSFDWQLAVGSYVRHSPMTLMLESQNGGFSLHFYQGSSLVLLRTETQDKWFSAISNDGPDDVFRQDVFQFMRVWYDEAEQAGLTAGIRIPDTGQSQEAVAKAWADAYEGAMLDVTPGSEFACTYVRNEVIGFPDWLDEFSPEELDHFYPAYTAGHERFAFQYKTVFVPENDRALSFLMAGNTGGYEGEDAPEGALEYSHCGYMYLTEDGWRCDGVGTGW